jgi:hypothetical protein
MQITPKEVQQASMDVTNALGDVFKWQWEEDRSALLSEFARDKKDVAFNVLHQNFSECWDKKAIKKAPNSLKVQLGELVKLNKEQCLFTRPATQETPALLAIWWPWGHGGTYSLRLVILNNSYDLSEMENSKGFFSSFINMFKGS